MTFTWTTIHVRDLDQSLAFYHDCLLYTSPSPRDCS